MLYASFLSCRSCLHVLAGWLQTLHSCKATTPLYPPWEKHFPCKQNSCSFPGGGIAIPDCDNPPPHTHLALASLSHDFTVFTDAVVCTSPELGLIMLAVITVSQPPRLQDLRAPSLHSGDCWSRAGFSSFWEWYHTATLSRNSKSSLMQAFSSFQKKINK